MFRMVTVWCLWMSSQTGWIRFFFTALCVCASCSLLCRARLPIFDRTLIHVLCLYFFPPIRFAEFGRALVESRLKDERIFLRYVGFLLEEQCNENIAAIRDMVYRHWDNSPDAPPKKRVSDNQVAEAPSLQILAWQDGPLWPDILLSRFPEGTCEAAEMLKQKEKFDVLYPPSSRPARPQSRDRAHRAGGCCDFSVDSEAKPIDLSRTLTLTFVEEADFSESRLGNGKILGLDNMLCCLSHGVHRFFNII